MAIQPMALAVQNPEINAVQAMSEGVNARQQMESNNLTIAKQSLNNIGSMAFGVMGGKIDGQADPQMWEQSLDMLAGSGMNVDAFRGRPDLAPIVARASVDTLGQLNLAQNERELEQRLQEFAFTVSEAAKGPAPTAEMRNFDWASGDPEKMAFMGKGPDGKPPTIVETFDPETGLPVKGYMNGTTFVPVGGVKAPSNGLTVTTNPDGTTTVQQGGAPKALTEGQGKDTVYSTRARGALPTIDEFGSALTNPLERAVESDPTGLARGMQSAEFQKAQQSGKEFLQAVLRKDTGAAITPDETAEYGSVYLPVPGDGAEVLEQKRIARIRAVEAMEAGMPPQAILAQEKALANVSAATGGGSPAAPAGEGISEGTIIENDAGQRMVLRNGNWESM